MVQSSPLSFKLKIKNKLPRNKRKVKRLREMRELQR